MFVGCDEKMNDSVSNLKSLAVLGYNDETEWLLRQWSRLEQWQVTMAASVGASLASLRTIAGAPDLVDEDWEAWQAGVNADAVLVTASPIGRFNEVLKRLASEGVPLLMVHPVCDGLTAHEIQMLSPTTKPKVVIWYPQRRPSFEVKLADNQRDLADSKIGAIMNVAWDYATQDVDRDSVLTAISRNVHFLLPCAGHWRSVQAISPDKGQSVQWERLGLTLLGGNEVGLQWQVKQQSQFQGAKVSLEGHHGRLSLEYNDRDCEWELNDVSTDRGAWEIESAKQAAAVVGERLAGVVDQDNVGDDWLGVCQSLEVADHVELSARRRRMVDLVQETPTEEATFKGVMAAGSCGLLMLVLAIFVMGSIFESVRRPRPKPDSNQQAANDVGDDSTGLAPNTFDNLLRFWPVFPLAIYLLLQMLLIVAKRGKPDAPQVKSDHRTGE